MKIKIILSILALTITFANTSFAQCEDEMGVFGCADMFAKDNIIFLSDFSVNKKIKKKDTEKGESWDVYLNSNTRYRFAICCNAGTEGIILEIREGEGKEAVGTTFDNTAYNEHFDYECKKSGNYKVIMSFRDEYKNKKKYCAIGLMGYIGKIN